jgi:hypothetical protein
MQRISACHGDSFMISPITASEAHNYRMAAEFCRMKQETGGSTALKIYSLPNLYISRSQVENLAQFLKSKLENQIVSQSNFDILLTPDFTSMHHLPWISMVGQFFQMNLNNRT